MKSSGALVLKTFVLRIFLMLGHFSTIAQAQMLFSQENLKAKTEIEFSLQQKLQKLIATSLHQDSFEVSVQVDLRPLPPEKKSNPSPVPRPAPTFGIGLPIDMTLGMIDAQQLMQSYQDEIETLRLREQRFLQQLQTQQAALAGPRFAVASARVVVGLDEQLGPEYGVSFKSWLDTALKSEFGKVPVTAEIRTITPKPQIPVTPKSPLDYISQFQLLFATALFVLGLVLAMLLSKKMSSRDAMEERSLRARLEGDLKQAPQALAAPETTPLTKEDQKAELARGGFEVSPPISPIELDMLRDVHHKVVWTANQTRQHLREVIQVWLESGEEGCQKAACLLDVVVSQNERFEKANGVETLFNFSALVPEEYREAMRKTFELMSKAPFLDKVQVLESVYWDLISIKALGPESLNKPFSFVSNLPPGQVAEVLNSQSTPVKVLALLHMKEEAQARYLELLPFERKTEIIFEAAQMKQIQFTDLETASETLKFEVKRTAQKKGQVQVSSLMPQLFTHLSAFEEVQLMSQIVPKLSDRGQVLKRSVPSLYFLSDWPQPLLKELLAEVSSDELLCLVRCLPQHQDYFISLAPQRTQDIVLDDLKLQDTWDLSKKEAVLKSLKTRVLKKLNRQGISLAQIFGDTQESSYAA